MNKNFCLTAFLACTLLMSGCSTVPGSARDRRRLSGQAQRTVRQFNRHGVTTHALRGAYAYAIFPRISTGGAGFGGAYGKGEVFRDGQMIAYTDVTQGTIGFQLGGGVFSELILFANRAAFDQFKRGKLDLAAQAQAVAASHGAIVTPDYQRGTAVYTMHQGGLMYQAAIGGQKFGYRPRSNTGRAGRTLRRTTGNNDYHRRRTTTTVKTKTTTPGAKGGASTNTTNF